MIPTINKKLLPIKGHYLLFNGATAPVIPMMPVIARQLGFSGTIVGLIYTVLPIAGMIAKPVLGGIADKYKCKKLLFILFQVVTAVALFGINWIPPIPTEASVHFACDSGESVFDIQNKSVDDNCAMDRVMNALGNKDVIRCTMDCNALTESEYETMCNYWEQGLQYCQDPNHQPNTFQFTALVPKDKIEIFDNAVVFKVVNISLHDGKIVKPLCPKEQISTECGISCDSAAVNELVAVPRSQEYDVLSEHQFWVFIVLAVLGWGGMAVVVSISDAICFEMLGDKPSKYGYQRMWGSVGWGVFSVFSGLLVDKYSDGQILKNYTAAFVMMLVLMALDVVVSTRLRYKQEFISQSIFRDVAAVLSRARVFVYLLWCIFCGMLIGLFWNFLFWHLEDVAKAYDDIQGECGTHGWIKTLEGLVQGIQCLGGELPFFFLSSWILNRVGHVHCMSLVLLGMGVRCILLSVLVNPWWALPVELLNGVTFGLFYATMASYASIVAPPGTEATVQGLVGAVFEGIGVSVGSLVGGILMDEYGGWVTFRCFGIASFVCCALHFIVQYFLARNNANSSDFDAVTPRYAPPKEAIRILDDDTQEFTLVDH